MAIEAPPITGPAVKKISLNFFAQATLSHMSPGQWRNPQDKGRNGDTLEQWVELAKLAERGKIAFIFLADQYGGHDKYKGSLDTTVASGTGWPAMDPFMLVSAMAAVTKSLGFGLTASTSYETPFALARRFSTLDHLTRGRVAWNIVTSYSASAARNMGQESVIPHDERYAMAEEYMEIMYKLWETSWATDALVHDKQGNMFTDPALVKHIVHEGKYMKMDGRFQVHPSPQRTPLLFQAGTSSAGKAFAARHAEAVYIGGLFPAQAVKSVREIRAATAALGRDPKSIKFFAGMTPIIGRTTEEAQAKYEEMKKYVDPVAGLAMFSGFSGMDLSRFPLDEPFQLENKPGDNAVYSILDNFAKASGTGSGKEWTPRMLGEKMALGGLHPTPVGTASHVADVMQQWIDECDVDGFNLSYVVMPGSFEDVVDLLRPELLRRGMVEEDYPLVGGTLRQNFYGGKDESGRPLSSELREDHPAKEYSRQRLSKET
ncbi:long-chain alkane monooxygenase, partial [Tremellales sp. Uapishka_1]